MDICRKTHQTDLCIVGGGLAGTIAAIAAAREGARVVLIQDRPMLGGNCSSEIRMWVRGAKGIYNREMGILAEFEEENIYRNPTLAPTLWDSVLFGKVKAEKNITLLLNCSCVDALCEDGRIKSVTAWQLTTYTWHTVEAALFADCSGDSILAPLTGALHRVGREAAEEYGESIAPVTADEMTMGMSLLLQARETEAPVPFIPPEWANRYETDEDFAAEPMLQENGSCRINARNHNRVIGTSGSNLWWLELGGDMPAVFSAEEVRDELLRVALGIWDHMKNRGDHGVANWELEWVGFLPGKRESVRYVGAHVLTQGDIQAGGRFFDTVAYGGWTLDDHNPHGIKAKGEPSKEYPTPSPYGIPYRCLYSVNVKNLFFAGRNISATHAAFSSTRVMGTCALVGQAMGTAAGMCALEGCMPADLQPKIGQLQKKLADAGVFLPGYVRPISTLTRTARTNVGAQERDILQNGVERPRKEGDRNHITLRKGGALSFDFGEKKHVQTLRMQFDPDFSRQSVSPHMKMQWFAQKLHRGLDFVPMKVAATIVRSFEVLVDGKCVYRADDNYHSLVQIPLACDAQTVTVVFHDTWGADEVRLFACDFIGGTEE